MIKKVVENIKNKKAKKKKRKEKKRKEMREKLFTKRAQLLLERIWLLAGTKDQNINCDTTP